MLDRLKNIIAKKKRLAVGLMSGTSLDGIDAALVEISGSGARTEAALKEFVTLPYSDQLGSFILKNSDAGSARLDEICRLNFLLGQAFAEAALKVIEKGGLRPGDIDFIGSHGQTIHHLPQPHKMFGKHIKSTMQIGEPALIADVTGILTVADFRPADVAAGGDGAPLIPYADEILFRSANECRVCLNIGGIANVTLLPPLDAHQDIVAFDTGPGNMLIDMLAERYTGGKAKFDSGGEIARSGRISPGLLSKLMEHPYLAELPPKSTGREEFGSEYLEWIQQIGKDLNWKDIISTITHFTVESIALSVERFLDPLFPVERIILSGGGAKNDFIINRLRIRLDGLTVSLSDDFGIPSDAKEALSFAILANETLHGLPSNLPTATGAKRKKILGKISFP
jgi:anhydro-N-acetylmuramic acid kinase